jgi:hypothetical protein
VLRDAHGPKLPLRIFSNASVQSVKAGIEPIECQTGNARVYLIMDLPSLKPKNTQNSHEQ